MDSAAELEGATKSVENAGKESGESDSNNSAGEEEPEEVSATSADGGEQKPPSKNQLKKARKKANALKHRGEKRSAQSPHLPWS